ncbi:MAG: hypothetical protein PUP92_03460 [Rhizonema sp. PD38]|nr:hypothetical protein [Rhizonema sp. PD38]
MPQKGQKQLSPILRFALVTKGSVGILPVVLTVVLPSFVSTKANLSNAAFAGVPEADVQWQTSTITQTRVELKQSTNSATTLRNALKKENLQRGSVVPPHDDSLQVSLERLPVSGLNETGVEVIAEAGDGALIPPSSSSQQNPASSPTLNQEELFRQSQQEVPSVIPVQQNPSANPIPSQQDTGTQFQNPYANPIPSQQTPRLQFEQNPNSPLSPSPQQNLKPSSSSTSKTRRSSKVNGAQIVITPVGDPRVQADGRSIIKLQGQILDEKGQLIRKDVLVTLTTSAGKFIGVDQDKDQLGFQVLARNGQFIATLQSDIKPQQVRVRAAVERINKPSPITRREVPILPNDESFPQQTDTSLFNQFVDTPIEAYTQLEFTTYLRPSLATGVVNLRIGAGGTDYWGKYEDFLNPNKIGGTTVDFKSSLFATGKVGEWLFTGAFNSYRAINEDCEGRNRLFGGVQFCEQQYPVYGDSSTFTPTTPSIDSVYARLERTSRVPGADPDYFMWGDFNTEEFSRSSQLYTATTRQLHGFKANYNFGPLQFTALYSHLDDVQGFQRDTIVPNGTTGYYFLSKRLLVPGSETVYVEAEEINRPGTVLERQQMLRYTDYDIDYDRGTIRFFHPINPTDLNPFGDHFVRHVVVTYQNQNGQSSNVYGGRLQYNFSHELENRTFAGASYLRDDEGPQNFELYGGDFLASFGNSGQIVGEVARSSSDLLNGRRVNGNAYRIEALGNFADIFQASAYYRSVEPNFANNATYSFTPGQTRYGASLLAKVTNSTSFRVAYDYEENYGVAPNQSVNFFDLFDPQPQSTPGTAVNNSLKTFRAGILQKLGSADVSVEYVNRSRNDRVNNVFRGSADQLVSRVKLPITDTLTFQAQNELTLSNRSDALYPNRTTLGFDWKAYPGVTFRLAHQFYDKSALLQGNSITTLDTIVDRKLSKDTSFTGRYSVLSAYNGLQGQGALGLNHGVRVAPGLKLDLGYQYVFNNIFNATAAGRRNEEYYAVGQTASTLGLFSGSVFSIGMAYTDNPNFKASARVEYYDGARTNNTVITAAIAGKLSPAFTILGRYLQAGAENAFLPSAGTGFNANGIQYQQLGDTANFKLGLAYRDPKSDKFNALLKYEWRQNHDTTVYNQLQGSTPTGHLFSAEGLYAPNWRWEFYAKYAFRNGVTYDSGNSYDNTAHLAQARASYKLGYRTDLAVEGRWIGQVSNSNNNYNEFGVAVEFGYYLTPDLRIGLGYSFGSVDANKDRDFTGYRSQDGIYVNISLKLNELFGGFGLQRPVPKQQQESEIPVSQVQPATGTLSPQSRLIQLLKKTQALLTPNRSNTESDAPKGLPVRDRNLITLPVKSEFTGNQNSGLLSNIGLFNNSSQ